MGQKRRRHCGASRIAPESVILPQRRAHTPRPGAIFAFWSAKARAFAASGSTIFRDPLSIAATAAPGAGSRPSSRISAESSTRSQDSGAKPASWACFHPPLADDVRQSAAWFPAKALRSGSQGDLAMSASMRTGSASSCASGSMPARRRIVGLHVGQRHRRRAS
jgi:hypothetical protein